VQDVLGASAAGAPENGVPGRATRTPSPPQPRPAHWDAVEPRERSDWRAGGLRWWRARPEKSTAAALCWLAAVTITLVVMLMPDADSAHVPALTALLSVGLATSLLLFATPASASELASLIGEALAIPGLALGVYLTGATHSPLLPLVFLLVAFAAYFSGPRAALACVAGAVVVCASPFLYVSGGAQTSFVVPFIALVTSASVLAGIVLYSRRELAQAELAAEALALADPLTGLPNRRAFADRVSEALAHASGDREDLMSVAMIDLDNFKRVNDRHGHAAGDAVLRAIADSLAAAIRKDDCVARIGGDEFALHAHGLDEAATRGLGDRCVRAVERAVRRAGYDDCGISATVAFALFPDHGKTLESLLHSADSALMRAKDEGKRQVVCARLREPVAG
jgi:diguanylate cyclase (GGDEF)-like protein